MLVRYSPTGVGPYGGDYPDERPHTRGECMQQPRPCPWVSCRYHLAIDAHRRIDMSRRLTVLNEDPTTMSNTCALDVADGIMVLPWREPAGEDEEAAQIALADVGELAGISTERARQTIIRVQRRMHKSLPQVKDDYEIEAEPGDTKTQRPRTQLSKAKTLIVRELATGAKHGDYLKDRLEESGIKRCHFQRATESLSDRIHYNGDRRGSRGIWTLVGGRQATHRDRGLPDETGSS